MSKPLVSIITPAYNAEKYITKLLESVSEQDYRPIEFIVVDDGSTDGTLSVLKSYGPMFSKKGIEFIVISQRNGGPPNAINAGLKKFTGNYLNQIDADDFLATKDSIKKRVEFLEAHKKLDVVWCESNIVNEDYRVIAVQREIYDPPRSNLFLSQLLEKDFVWVPNAYIIRASAFHKANPKRKILDKVPGQNIQMQLPIFYKGNNVGYIAEPLVSVLAHSDSDSRKYRSPDEQIKYFEGVKSTYIDTLNKIEMPDRERANYIQIIENKYEAILGRIEIAKLNSELESHKNPGVKLAARKLGGAIKRRLVV
jgi:glycosyltransferase involved in cell wall biosynthesis